METNTIISTNFSLATAVIANGAITGNPFSNPNNLLLVDGQVAESNPGSGTASDVTIGNYNYQNTDGTFGIPQNAVVTGFEFELIGYRGMQTSPVITVTPYLYDNLNGADQYYPYVTPFEGLTPDLDTYVLGDQNYLFASQFSVDQVNNAKFALVANGDVYIDSFLVKVYYYVPSTDPDPTPSTDNCDGCDSVLQIQAMQLQLPFLIGDTAFYLKPFSMQYPDGTTAQPGDVGTCGGIVNFVFDEGKAKTANNNNFEENASLPYDPSDMNTPTWIVLSNGVVKVDLKTTDNRGLDYKYPYTHADSRMSDHDANSKVIISNNGPYSFNLLKRCDIGNLVSAPIEVDQNGSLIAKPVTKFNFIGAGQTTAVDLINDEQVNITIPGVGGTTPPQVVSTASGTSRNVQVRSVTFDLEISGLNRIALIQISCQQNAGSSIISSVKGNGNDFTQVVSQIDSTNDLYNEQWAIVSPVLGTMTIVITFSQPTYVSYGAECIVGVDTVNVIGNTSNDYGTSFGPSTIVTTLRDYSLVFDGITTAKTPILLTPGPGESLNWSKFENQDTRQGASSAQPAGLQSDTVIMQYSITQNTPWVMTGVEVLGITSATPPSAGVSSIIAGTNVTISSTGPGGTGDVTVNATGSGSSITLKTNGTNNGSQTVLNLAAGSGISVTDNGTGTVTIANTGSGGGSANISNSETAGVSFTGATQQQAVVFGDGSSSGLFVHNIGVVKLGDTSSDTKRAYDVTPLAGVAIPCGGVTFQMNTVGTPPASDVKVSIQTDNAGVPSGTIIGSATSTMTVSGGTSAMYNFTWTPISLTNGVKIWVVIERISSSSNSSYYEISSQPSSNADSTVYNGTSWVDAGSGGIGQVLYTGLISILQAGLVYGATISTSYYNAFTFTGFPGNALTTPTVLNGCDGVVTQTIAIGSSINVISDGVFTVTGSAITPGSNYFVASNSDLATSGSIKVGRALVGGTTFFIRRY